jgi:hypothetical protein
MELGIGFVGWSGVMLPTSSKHFFFEIFQVCRSLSPSKVLIEVGVSVLCNSKYTRNVPVRYYV